MPELICSADDPAWLDRRREGITATDIPVIMGLATWASPWSLYMAKTGQLPPQEDTDRFRLGRHMEPYVVGRWAQEHELGDLFSAETGGLYRSADRSWQLATLDRAVYRLAHHDGKVNGRYVNPEAVLEVKSWADADKPRWDDAPPPAVRAQVLWQMDVMGVSTGHVGVVFLPSGEFRSYVLEHDHMWPLTAWQPDCTLCADIDEMRIEGAKFHLRVSEPDKYPPPSVDGSAATLAALQAAYLPAEGPAADINQTMWLDFVEFKQRAKFNKSEMRRIEAMIREQAGTATRYTVGGTIVGRRIRSVANVKAFTRTQDYIRVLNTKDNDDDD